MDDTIFFLWRDKYHFQDIELFLIHPKKYYYNYVNLGIEDKTRKQKKKESPFRKPVKRTFFGNKKAYL